MQVVSQRLPAELPYPRVDGWLAPDQELRLTIAGAAACSGSQEEVRFFLEVVRLRGRAGAELAGTTNGGDRRADPEVS